MALSLALVATGSGLSQTGGQWWPDAGAMNLSLLTSVGIAMVSVLWAYEGWQYVTFSAGEATNPQRTFPRALILGTTAIVGIYLLANLGYLAALGPAGIARRDAHRRRKRERVARGAGRPKASRRPSWCRCSAPRTA